MAENSDTMMQHRVSDAASKLANHYASYVNSPFLRKAVNLVEISTSQSTAINDFIRMTSAGLLYDLKFLYDAEIAFALFCDSAFHRVAPGIGQTLYTPKEIDQLGLTESEKQLCRILLDSFPANIKQLAINTYTLYQQTLELDTETAIKNTRGKKIYHSVMGVDKIEALLKPIITS